MDILKNVEKGLAYEAEMPINGVLHVRLACQ
jgi:hypothetical protein